MDITNINLVDIIIILFILMGGAVGLKEGVIKKLVSIIGLILVVFLAFKFKNQLSSFFYENLPFFNLWGVFKGIQVMNILFYETLAFLIIASVLMIAYNVIIGISGLVEKILKATVILSIPSKILGFIVGLFEGYIWVYLALFILSLPIINFEYIYDSKVANTILDNTPILSRYTEKSVSIYHEIRNIIENRGSLSNEEINEKSLDLMLEYDIISYESARKLIEKNKINVTQAGYQSKYRNGKSNISNNITNSGSDGEDTNNPIKETIIWK